MAGTAQRRVTLCALAAALVTLSMPAWGRRLRDMAGREVTLPDTLRRVLPYDNKTNVLLFPVAGELMIARARWMRASYFMFITPAWSRLREVDMRQAEEVMRLHPEALIVGAFPEDRTSIEEYAAFAKRVNVPLVVVDIDLMHMDKAIDFLGNLLGRQARAAELSGFIRSVYRDVEEIQRRNTVGEKRPRAYMANDANGLRTAPRGSRHAQLFDVLGVENVVAAPPGANGFAYVSIEQLLLWRPEYILCVGKGEVNPYRTVCKSSLWRTLPAVQSGRVYYVPEDPYSWFDIPPSANRLAGLIWFMGLFGEQTEDITEKHIREFYRLFYNYTLSDREYRRLFEWR